eukprot:scaffold112849_cov14-Tisochrysis_lutea.AAC.1
MHNQKQGFKRCKIQRPATLNLSLPSRPKSWNNYYTEAMQADNIKHGKYLPKEAPRNYPLDQAEQSDSVPNPFILQSQFTKEELG